MSGVNSGGADLPPEILKTALDLWSQVEGEHFLTITGQSMLPLIHPGDKVLVQKGKVQATPGDIVVYIDNKGFITHRLLTFLNERAGEIEFLAKGDRIPYPDSPVGIESIIGIVIGIKRGQRSMRLDTPTWRQLNSLIATLMLPIAHSYRQTHQPDHKNPQYRLPTICYRVANACFILLWVLILPLLSHWETVS